MSQFDRVKYDVPNLFDAHELVDNMRLADRIEIQASHDQRAIDVAIDAIDMSSTVMTIRVDGVLLGIWGVVELDSDPGGVKTGTPWLLTTVAVERYPVLFWKLSVLEIQRLRDDWPLLVNFIDIRHTQAIRWAERLGLPLEDPAPFGVGGKLFRRFVCGKGEHHGSTSSHRPSCDGGVCRNAGESPEASRRS